MSMTYAEKYLHLQSEQVTTKQGRRTVRRIPLSESFWSSWRAHKEAMKAEGISVFKNERTGQFEARLWTAPEEQRDTGAKEVETKPISEGVKSKLLGHQAEHVAKLRSVIESRGAAMDMSETGTGKTYTAAGLAKEMGLRPIFITKVANIKEATRVLEEHMGIKDQVVVNYEMLRTGKMRDKSGKTVDAPFLRKVENPAKGEPAFEWTTTDKDLIIFDESHKGKNKGTLNT